MRPNGIADFWLRVAKTEGCWLWKGSTTPNGYGQFVMVGVPWSAHRLSYTVHFGPIPNGVLVCHHCDVRTCVRPDHLFLGTTDDNMADMVAKGRSLKGERNAISRLTSEQVRQIRARYIVGKTRQVDLAAEFGVSQPTVSRLILGRGWQHLD